MGATADELAPQEYLRIVRDPSTPLRGGRATFIVSGELDIASMHRLVEAVMPDAVPGAHLVLDLSCLEFMDGSGMSALVEILTALGPDGRLTVWRPSSPVRMILELVGAECFPALVILDS
jgi:anti-anti-sigma factor